MNSKALMATTALILALSAVSCGKDDSENSASIAYGESTRTTITEEKEEKTTEEVSDVETVEMPDVTNMHSDLAKDQLALIGLECEIRNSENIEIPPGYVISTEPEAKTEVNKGETIVLYVSTGAEEETIEEISDMETVEMPDVTNMHSDLAKDQLALIGLECEIRETANIEITPDYVISTEPEAKTEVNKGETIILYVSTGVDGN
ncbi:MAG: PASTA domain-containing protein [Ruminococcus sp.]|nr:PASTA domain-containing protein [Ruminococcus sp.]